jgi:copper homeostasis protein
VNSARSEILIEAAVESLDDAMAAVAGGADRLELCANLDAGGTTPRLDLIEAVVARAGVPVVVMIRPRGGRFVFTSAETDQMQREVEAALAAGGAGVVLGVLDVSGRVDVSRTGALVAAAGGRPVTFHRAIDGTPDMLAALDAVTSLGISRVLSSGGAQAASEGTALLGTMVARAGTALTIVAGGGVRDHNVRGIVARSGVREVHARCGGDAMRIRAIRRALDRRDA